MIRKREWALIGFNVLYLLFFTAYYIVQKNYEFLVYVGVVLALFVFVCVIQHRARFPLLVLWLLSLWGLLHMMGGGLHLPSGEVLYRWIPIELYNAHDANGEFVILKFDQILHFYIYFVMSLVIGHIVFTRIGRTMRAGYVACFVALASMGVSVINELIEFGAVVYLGQTGVGGYFNTLLDLVFNTFGAVVGSLVALRIYRRNR